MPTLIIKIDDATLHVIKQAWEIESKRHADGVDMTCTAQAAALMLIATARVDRTEKEIMKNAKKDNG